MSIPPPLLPTNNKTPELREMDTREVKSKYFDCREDVKQKAESLLCTIKFNLDYLNKVKSMVKHKYNQELLDKYLQSFEQFSEMVSKGWAKTLADGVDSKYLIEKLKITEKLNKDFSENLNQGPVA